MLSTTFKRRIAKTVCLVMKKIIEECVSEILDFVDKIKLKYKISVFKDQVIVALSMISDYVPIVMMVLILSVVNAPKSKNAVKELIGIQQDNVLITHLGAHKPMEVSASSAMMDHLQLTDFAAHLVHSPSDLNVSVQSHTKMQ